MSAFPRVEYAEFNQEPGDGRLAPTGFGGFSAATISALAARAGEDAARHRGKVGVSICRIRTGTRRQMNTLLTVADEFDVPAAYVVFFGDASERPDLVCGSHSLTACTRCERSTVRDRVGAGGQSGVRLAEPDHPDEVAPDAFRQSVPIEDLALGRCEASST